MKEYSGISQSLKDKEPNSTRNTLTNSHSASTISKGHLLIAAILLRKKTK